MKKAIVIFLCCVAMLLYSSCDNPDFAPYEGFVESTSVYVEGNPFVISEIEEDMYQIAESYAEDITLSQVEYNFDSKDTGTTSFYYYRIDDDKTTIIILELDVSESEVTRVIYEKGHSKRVSASGSYIENKSYNANRIYEEIINHMNAKGIDIRNPLNMKITFINNRVRVNYYDKFNKWPYGYDYPLGL